jgi:hypothetical protein
MNMDMLTELKKLAEEILLIKDVADLELIHEKVVKLYEKIIVLNYLNKKEEIESIEKDKSDIFEITESIKNQLDIEVFADEIIVENSPSEDKKELEEVDSIIQNTEEIDKPDSEDIQKEPISLNDLFVPTFDSIKEDMSQKEEFKDTVSLEETEKLFETKKGEVQQLSLNDKLLNSSIQIGLNDRIAFVNNLFNFSQSEFNKVLSRLNDCKNKQEALNYIHYTVKPNYDWNGKEELEERLILIIERKFL